MTDPQQYASHEKLLARFRPGRTRLSGIVTPATRDAGSVLNNVKLAALLRVPVVVMCSKGADPSEIAGSAASTGADCTVIDLDPPHSKDLFPTFATDEFADGIEGAYGDLSLKRNLGLLLGRLAGWSTLLFLDDDLFDIDPAQVRRAVGSLQHHAAVGMPATDFPDNSVVCHARRLASGVQQGVFVSGSALAVDLTKADSFFPQVYNEDWLFLAPLLERRAVTAYREVNQAFFNPFDSPERAVRQEFGDVLAESLVGHLHSGRLSKPLPRSYFRGFLYRRGEVIAEALRGCREKARTNPYAEDAHRSLVKAEETRAKITPSLLGEYVDAWQLDLRMWRRFLAEIGPAGSLDGAIDELGLTVRRESPVLAPKGYRNGQSEAY